MNININTGEVRLTVNSDPERVIRFNPQDVGFAERFYGLITEFEGKEKEYRERTGKLAESPELDGYGLPRNAGEGLRLLREICEYLKGKIDYVFGPGTSQAAFGEAVTLDMFEQFFEGITPLVQTARGEKIGKYTQDEKRNVLK